jgi:hypothetical protein
MSQRIRTVVLAASLVAGTGVLGAATPASAAPVWNAAGTIHPGVQTVTAGSQCTANFVFYDSSNNVYIGQSAHCASTGGPTDTNGCTTGSQPLNTNVTVGGATRPGKLVYSSWLAMQSASPAPSSTECAYNDFAIVKLDPADYGRVNPSIPFWGGPSGVNTTGLASRSYVYTYGNSSLRFGLTPLSPKLGLTNATTTASSWTYSVYTVSPGIPGDSGSAFVDRNGRALGTLSTLSADGSNGVASLNQTLTYLRAHSSYTTLQVANGLTAFNPIV